MNTKLQEFIQHLSHEIEDETKEDFDVEGIGALGLDGYMSQIEDRLIRYYMKENNGNITRAAEDLKIKRQTLQHKLKKYN